MPKGETMYELIARINKLMNTTGDDPTVYVVLDCVKDLAAISATPLELIAAITEQTKAINALVESNQRLMSILLEGAADEPEESMLTYLDGTPKG